MTIRNGIRSLAGTAVPMKVREGERPGPIVTYHLSPEEIEKQYGHIKPLKSKDQTGLSSWARLPNVRSEQPVDKSVDNPVDEDVDKMQGVVELTREAYLHARSIKTRADIAKEQGWNPAELLQQLREWGLKDTVVEEREIKHAEGEPVDEVVTTSAEQPDKSKLFTINVPMEPVDWPITATDNLRAVSRDELIVLGFACIRNAAAWAAKDLKDITGKVDAETIEQFMVRKVAELVN